MLFDLSFEPLSRRLIWRPSYSTYRNETRPAIFARMIAENPSMRLGAHKREHLRGLMLSAELLAII
jgi:hypothetical protein